MKQLDIDRVRTLYENIKEVWPEDDLWHQYSKKNIEHYISKQFYDENAYILNAGSGGNTYGLNYKMHHVDIAKNLIEHYTEYTVSSIEKLPLVSDLFSDAICVGSVLNYCDAFAAIAELSRVLKKNGKLILEFESSWGFEHIKSKEYKQTAALVEVRYHKNLSTQWIYSPTYIKRALAQAGFRVVHTFRFHYLSGLHYSKHQNENSAAAYTKFDAICRFVPFLKQHSNNVIYTCIKL